MIYKNKVESFLEFFRTNALYLLIWSIAIFTVFGVNMLTKNTHSFVGVTVSKELNINSKYPVVVKSLKVLPGQFVQAGHLLAELDRPDLNLRINEVSHRLEELLSQYNLNTELNGELTSLVESNEKESSKKEKKEEIAQIEEDEQESEDSLGIQIRSLEKELKILFKEKQELYIFSEFSGNIGSINFKEGESVSPFQTIISMHEKTPTLVKGYIHENIYKTVQIGKEAKVSNLSGQFSTIATVVSVGSKIIPFPQRFLRSFNEQIYGREVILQIDPENSFILGEKVFLEVIKGPSQKVKTKTKRTIADEFEKLKNKYSFITRPVELSEEHTIEPSGLLYLEDLQKHALVSDDTYKNKPIVYLINDEGELDQQVLKVDGIKKLKDLEAISIDEKGMIYLAASQSRNKKGKVDTARNMLVKLSRNGFDLKVEGKIELRLLLAKLVRMNRYKTWARLISKKKKDKKTQLVIDVEGIAIAANTLYLGLRNPVGKNKEVAILKIKNLNKLFDDEKLKSKDISLWRLMRLPVKSKMDMHEGISDLMIKDDVMYFTTANNKTNDSGRVFKLAMEKGAKPQEIARFEDQRPEGISFSNALNKFMIVFDSNTGTGQNLYTVIEDV